MEIGERIRQIRIHKKLTQKDLVDGICSLTYLSRIENKQIQPSKAFLLKIADKLDINIGLLTEEDTSEFESDINEITEKYRNESIISPKEIALLELNVQNTTSLPMLLKSYSVLIAYYLGIDDVERASILFEDSTKVIPSSLNTDHQDDFFFYYIKCGNFFYRKQNHLKANEFYTKAEKLMDGQDVLEKANLYYNLSLANQNLYMDANVSLFYSEKALNLFKELELNESLAAVCISRGTQFHINADYPNSLKSLKEAEALLKNLPKPAYSAMIQYNFGKVYQGMQEFSKAIEHFKNAITIHNSISSRGNQIHSQLSLIEIYIQQKEWEKVEPLLKTAFEQASIYEKPLAHMQLLKFKASILRIRGDEYNYEKEMQRAIKFGQSNGLLQLIKEFSIELANYYADVRAYKLSTKYYKIALENSLTE